MKALWTRKRSGRPESGAPRDTAELTGCLGDRLAELMAAADAARDGIAADHQAFCRHASAEDRADAEPLVEALTERLGAISSDCEEVVRLLQRYERLLAARAAEVAPEPAVPSGRATRPPDPRGADSFQTAAPAPAGSRPAPAPAPAAAPAPSPMPPGQVTQGVRLLATQMAVSGAGREEIAARLAADHGLTDAAPLLDALFPEE